MQALSKALAMNSSLVHLDLRSNAVSLVGCRLLSELLQGGNSSIRCLQLSGNMGSTEAAVVLVSTCITVLLASFCWCTV
jgi:Ran GTPase-activating protein (RanGAP) involved in mRNA processing and transport